MFYIGRNITTRQITAFYDTVDKLRVNARTSTSKIERRRNKYLSNKYLQHRTKHIAKKTSVLCKTINKRPVWQKSSLECTVNTRRRKRIILYYKTQQKESDKEVNKVSLKLVLWVFYIKRQVFPLYKLLHRCTNSSNYVMYLAVTILSNIGLLESHLSRLQNTKITQDLICNKLVYSSEAAKSKLILKRLGNNHDVYYEPLFTAVTHTCFILNVQELKSHKRCFLM